MSPSPDIPPPCERSILVVDDEPTLRLAYCYALKDDHTRVEAVGDGHSALDRLKDTRFDLVLLDLRMPHLDGGAVLDVLRDSGNLIPVILCCSVVSPGLIQRAARNGVVDLLLKPVMPAALRQAVDLVIHPEQWPNATAWKSARNGDYQAAALHLRQSKHLTARESAWLRIWDNPADLVVPQQGPNILALNGAPCS